MPSSLFWGGGGVWLSLVLECFPPQKWSVHEPSVWDEPPAASLPPEPQPASSSRKSVHSRVSLFLPHAHVYYSFIIDEWPPGSRRRLSSRPGTFTISAHWPASFFFFCFFFLVSFRRYWLLLHSFPLECFLSPNFLHHYWTSNLPIIDPLLEFRPTATYFTPQIFFVIVDHWTSKQLSLFLVDLFSVLH